MGSRTAALVLASLIAVYAGCSGPQPAPGRAAAGATRDSVAGAATAPASVATPGSPATPSGHRHGHAARRPVPYGVGCQPADLRLAQGPRLSQATSQETLILTLTNISEAGCDLQGYPGLSLLDRAGLALPFAFRRGGTQMLTTSAPVLVPLAPGRTAYLGITKWACVGHWHGVARTFRVIPPSDYQPLSLTTRYPVVGYCPPGDPGHIVNVTPVEPSLRSVLNGHLTGASR